MLAVLVARHGQIEHQEQITYPFNAKVLVDNQDILTVPDRAATSTFVHCKGNNMHREPTPKSQAKIVRRAFADHGVDLPHRQALDVVAQVHGHANWHVMQAKQATAVALPSAPPAPAPANVVYPVRPSANATPASGTVQLMTFEGIGFVQDREDFDQLVDNEQLAERIWESLKGRAAAFGLTGFECAYLSEDDEQDDDDIKVFIGVKLLGHCSWGDNEQAPRELADLLDELAVSVCCDSNGKQLVHPDDWELFDVEDAE
jgi:hypothetical protein